MSQEDVSFSGYVWYGLTDVYLDWAASGLAFSALKWVHTWILLRSVVAEHIAGVVQV